MSARGKVYLVGAGSGDVGLLTLKGKAVLERCDVVLYDRLANPRLLEFAPRAEAIFVGKRPGQVALEQDGINALLVKRAQAGQIVCRLKAGDPYVFGRGGEEALACLEAGVPFVTVPGITSAIAAPSYAGIPVTHRNLATSFAVITGHENPDKPEAQVDWSRVAGAADTLLFLMGVGNLPEIVAQLVAHGRPASTPVALVRWGTWPQHDSLRGTLADIVEKVRTANFKPPAVTVVGEVAGLDPRLAWYEQLPLRGKTVVVTRSRTQTSALVEELSELGAEVLEFPVIRIEPREVALPLAEAFGWVIFTSTNAVELFLAALDAAGADARWFAGARLAAIGSATAAALRQRSLRADFVPRSFNADEFVAEFPASGERVLIPCAAKASPTIPEALRRHGAEVTVLPLYDTVLEASDAEELGDRLAAGGIDAITFTSSSTAENFRELLPDANLAGICLASIGPKTSATMRTLGLPPTVEAAESTIAQVIAAVRSALGQS